MLESFWIYLHIFYNVSIGIYYLCQFHQIVHREGHFFKDPIIPWNE